MHTIKHTHKRRNKTTTKTGRQQTKGVNDRKSVREGESVDSGESRIRKKKKTSKVR